MNPFISLFAVSFYRAVFSWFFLIGVCGVALMSWFTAFGMIGSQSDLLSVVIISGSGNILLIVGILPVIPFAITFASEWEERAVSFWIIRSGVRRYAFNKVIVSALSGFMVTFVGILLHAFLLWTRLPLYTTFQTGDAYASLLKAGRPLQYLLFSAAHLSLSSSLFAVAALWISAYIPNRWTAIAAPIVLYFVLLRFTRNWNIPSFLKIGTIVEGTYHASSPLSALLFKLATVMLLCWLIGYGTMRQIQRRVQHD
jgi:hypothetical protein